MAWASVVVDICARFYEPESMFPRKVVSEAYPDAWVVLNCVFGAGTLLFCFCITITRYLHSFCRRSGRGEEESINYLFYLNLKVLRTDHQIPIRKCLQNRRICCFLEVLSRNAPTPFISIIKFLNKPQHAQSKRRLQEH
jgi:hypothetical protein